MTTRLFCFNFLCSVLFLFSSMWLFTLYSGSPILNGYASNLGFIAVSSLIWVPNVFICEIAVCFSVLNAVLCSLIFSSYFEIVSVPH